jgi:predicted membrane channel-forming protein YqfA (hemolysin III family)
MLFYVTKMPERKYQKSRFVAYWLSSHTIWHIFAWLCAN